VFGIETISLFIFSTIQFGFGSWQLTLKKTPQRLGNRNQNLVLTGLFFVYNISSILQLWGVSLVQELSGLALATYFLYFLAFRLSPVKSNSSKWAIALCGIILSGVFVAVFFPASVESARWHLISFVPTLMIFYIILAVMISYVNRINSNVQRGERVLQSIIQAMLIILLSGMLLFDVSNPHLQLTVNMVFILFASEFIFRVRAVSFGWVQLLGDHLTEQAPHDVWQSVDLSHFDLTITELLVAEKMFKGLSSQQIADDLERSVEVVYKHNSNIYRKSNTRSPQEFILKVYELARIQRIH